MEYQHVSVMLNACIQALRIRPEGVYIDCTAGLGGHSEQIARRLTEGGRLLCIDQDTDAVRACRQRLAPYINRVAFIEDNYSNVRAAAAGCGVTRIDGALIDLGNFMCADEDPWKSVGIMSPYAFHVHAKDFFRRDGDRTAPGDGWFQTRSGDYLRGTIIGHGDARISQSIQTLKRKGYDGFVTIEFEGIEDNLLGIEWGLKNLKRFIEA